MIYPEVPEVGVTEGDLYGVAGVFEQSVETRNGMAGFG